MLCTNSFSVNEHTAEWAELRATVTCCRRDLATDTCQMLDRISACQTPNCTTYLEKFRKDIIIPHFFNHFERVVEVVDVLNVHFEELGLKI